MTSPVRFPSPPPLVLAVAAGAVYAITACPFVLGGDVGEFATLAAAGGVAHPPGYPLYVLWLRAFAWLPARSPAHAAALATAILGAAAVWALQRACTAWGASRTSTAIFAALFAFSPLAWDLSTHAEVFALNAFLAAAILVLAAPGDPPFGREHVRVGLLGLVAGLGIANHHTIVLLAPIGLYAAIRGVRRGRARAAALGAFGLAVGVAPYAYLVLAAHSPLAWGDTSTLAGVVHHFLRADYGTTKLSASDAPPLPLANLGALAKTLLVGLFGAPLLALGLARKRPGAPLVLLVVSFALCGPLFVMRFDLAATGVQARIAERFHLLPCVLACVLGSLGLDVVARERLARYGGLVVAVLAGARAATAWPTIAERQRPTVEHYMKNALRSAPRDAVLLETSDGAVGAYFYETVALGNRADVVLVSPRLLLGDWFARRTSEKLGFAIVHGEKHGDESPTLDAAALVTQLLRSGRPVVAGDWLPSAIAASAPSYPIGPLVRLTPDPKTIPSPYDLEATNVELFARFDLEP
ncbi:MAG TPA: DUF2723 domain-containing protein, partial [Labilithrix sp.]